jgi:competence protein ComEA
MTGISRGEKWILALTAVFLLTVGGWFLLEKHVSRPWQVTVGQESTSAAEMETGRPDSLLEGEVIDLNTADVGDLRRLPGIGEKRAQAIVEYRETVGPFERVEDLVLVKGIGEGILAGLRDYVTVSGGD